MSIQFEENIEIMVEKVLELIHAKEDLPLIHYLEELHPADIAEIIWELEDGDRDRLFGVLSWEDASRVLEELDGETFSDLIHTLTREQKVKILDLMSQDDIVDHLSELSDDRRREILSLLDKEDAEDVRELLVYQEDTAGGIMTKDFVALDKDKTIYRAIETLREEAPDAETIYYVYVVDKDERLKGVITLRELIVSKPNKLIEDIMIDNIIRVNVNTDQEEVARIFSKYDFLALPVVDDDDVLRGIITVDDIIDVIEEEATEDIMKLAGTSENEDAMEEEKIFLSIWLSIKARLPWLIITIFGGLLSANVVNGFQASLDKNTTIALFMPLLAGMGGNVGTQSSTVTVRSIAMGHIQGMEAFKTLFQEILIGVSVGLICSCIVAVISFVWKAQMILSLIIGLSMLANIVTAATIGTMVPLVFKRVGVDPAVASAPFITTTIDITGLSIYFTLATIMMQRML